jgi:hypothetical protein
MGDPPLPLQGQVRRQAAAATAAQLIVGTRSARPVLWRGAAITGRWVFRWARAMAVRSCVVRVNSLSAETAHTAGADLKHVRIAGDEGDILGVHKR